jgi:hypothetical protein
MRKKLIAVLIVAVAVAAATFPRLAEADDSGNCWLQSDGRCGCTWINLCPGGPPPGTCTIGEWCAGS